jgi:RNA polymerase sigma factor (sigma-70 family)
MSDDNELLKTFVQSGDARAFAALVERYIALAYSTARAQLGDAHLAEDAVQGMFIVLARKAGTIRPNALPAWIISTTLLVARGMRRSRRRAARREAVADAMSQERRSGSGQERRQDPAASAAATDAAEVLHAQLATLADHERVAVTLRYLQGMSLNDVAAATQSSVPAAAKRIERALAKLRQAFNQRELVLSLDGVALLLAARGLGPAPPAYLAQRVVETALAALAAAQIRRAVWRRRLTRHVPAVAAAILLALLAVAAVIKQLPGSSIGQRRSIARATTADTMIRPIRTGVMLSEFTATASHPGNETFDLGHQNIILQLTSPKLELFMIVNPGRQTVFGDTIRKIVHNDDGHIILANDLAALRKLDVIVADHIWMVRPDELRAIHTAVEGGVGFLQQAGFAIFVPSYSREVMTMQGVAANAQFYENRNYTRCTVASEHDLLRGLKVGQTVSVRHACGTVGQLQGVTPLLLPVGEAPNEADPRWTDFVTRQTRLVRAAEDAEATQPSASKPTFCPLYLGSIGAGRMIACQWHNECPGELRLIAGGDFYLRCIQWLAHRPLD